jgi:hypothetical protein
MIEAFVRAIADGDATAALGLADWLEDEGRPVPPGLRAHARMGNLERVWRSVIEARLIDDKEAKYRFPWMDRRSMVAFFQVHNFNASAHNQETIVVSSTDSDLVDGLGLQVLVERGVYRVVARRPAWRGIVLKIRQRAGLAADGSIRGPRSNLPASS